MQQIKNDGQRWWQKSKRGANTSNKVSVLRTYSTLRCPPIHEVAAGGAASHTRWLRFLDSAALSRFAAYNYSTWILPTQRQCVVFRRPQTRQHAKDKKAKTTKKQKQQKNKNTSMAGSWNIDVHSSLCDYRCSVLLNQVQQVSKDTLTLHAIDQQLMRR